MSNSDIPEKYKLEWFKVPQNVKDIAEHYLVERKKLKKSQRGAFTPKDAANYNAEQAKAGKETHLGSGHQRAVTLVNDEYIKPKTIRRMKAFFDRHSVYKRDGYHTYKETIKKVKDKKNEDKIIEVKIKIPSKSLQSWWSWGGDPGYEWAKNVVAKMNEIDEKDKKSKKTISEHIDSLVEKYFFGEVPSLKETKTLLNKVNKLQK
jgi:hypothetical protein